MSGITNVLLSFCSLLLYDWQVKGRFKKDIYRDEFEPSNRFPHLTLTLFFFLFFFLREEEHVLCSEFIFWLMKSNRRIALEETERIL